MGWFNSIKRVGYTTMKNIDWRVCDIKCQHACGPKIIENYPDFSIATLTSSFYYPCSVHSISLINACANEYLASEMF